MAVSAVCTYQSPGLFFHFNTLRMEFLKTRIFGVDDTTKVAKTNASLTSSQRETDGLIRTCIVP